MRHRVNRALVLASLVLALASSWRIVDADEACVLCHAREVDSVLSEPVTIVGRSAHGSIEGMSCANCHGGLRDESTARAHDPDAGFVARPAPEEVTAICGGCHADAHRLGQAVDSLPMDQLQLYEESGHGRALARGNGGAATCISCHGTHDIQPATNPESLIHPDNMATTCGACHSDEEAMSGSGSPLTQMSRWRRSIHGRFFVDDEESDSPTCNGCHDAHGGITGLDDIAACARCHRAQEISFAASPHAEVFQRLGFEGCVECHGSHDVREAHATLVGGLRNSTCLRCHSDGQVEIYETIMRIGQRRSAAEEAARRGFDALERLAEAGLEERRTSEIRVSLDEAALSLSLAVHSFDEAALEPPLRSSTSPPARAVALERTALGASNPLSMPTWIGMAGAVFVVFLLTFGWLLRRRR